jgi:hypothetical protein
MTLTTLITVNAILGFAVVWGLVYLLGHGVHSDRHHRLERAGELLRLPKQQRDKIAA